jgi:hypothetical protein
MVNVVTDILFHEGTHLIHFVLSIAKKKHSDYNKKFYETDIIKMIPFLIDNIFIILSVFQ